MVVTIDGPAGAGKSSAARALARRLGFSFLDTGAMYRAVALAAQRSGIPWSDSQGLADLARRINIRLSDDAFFLDDEDVTRAIRDPEVTDATQHVADNLQVRQQLANLQRLLAQGGNYVTEGRDQGTVVFPDAPCKIFLTATAIERARRRWADLQALGQHARLQDVLEQQNLRDARDLSRAVGRLARAADAIEVNTDGMTLEEVVDRLEHVVRQRLASGGTN